MATFEANGQSYCYLRQNIGKFKEFLTLYERKKTIQWAQFEKQLIHQANFGEVKVCPSGGKTRRRRNRKQRKTRRH
jgi:hypothetical protein